MFNRNTYPNDFVDRCIKQFFDKLYITKKLSNGREKAIIDNSPIIGSFIV